MIYLAFILLISLLRSRAKPIKTRIVIHRATGYIDSRPFSYGKHGGVIR